MGTGDSEGEFSDASIPLWLRNLDAVASWAANRNLRIDTILGVRFGCLLAAQWVHGSRRQLVRSIFWQPTLSGEQIVRQWLRTRVSAAMFDGSAPMTTADLSSRLNDGEALEIGGYLLTPSFAGELRALEMSALLGPGLGQTSIFEIGEGIEISPALGRLQTLHRLDFVARIRGDPFWSSSEIVRNSTLIQSTVRRLMDDQA
jgi:hypothetical protein